MENLDIQFFNLIVAMWGVIITIILAIVGWFFSLYLQNKNIKEQHKNQIKYDIYKQLVQAKSDIQEPLNFLGASVVTPFILMESSMIPFECKLKKPYKDIWVDYSESECILDGKQKWDKYVNDIRKSYSDLSSEYIKLMSIFENWESALSRLIKARNILFSEIDRLKKSIYNQIDFFQMYSMENGSDWREWNRDDLSKRAEDIRDSSFEIGSYINDFLILAHNELVAKYFGHSRKTRKTLDPKYKVLTLSGLVESVDKEKIDEMKVNKEKLMKHAKSILDRTPSSNGKISPDFKNFLDSVMSGVCPACKAPIEVNMAEEDEDNFSFTYFCGHGWKGVTINETIGVSEFIKSKATRPRIGWFRKTAQGHKSSGDPKLKDGVDYFMDIDKEKNEYHQIVKDNKTKEILHEEHEPLTEHRSKK